MSGFSVEAAELQAAQGYLVDLAEEGRARVARVRAEVEGLVSAGWRGGAAAGFAQGWERWESGCQQTLTALSEMAELLGSTGRTYAVSEADTASPLTSLADAL